ncbi:Cullin-domain-containing protein [Suillus lakei]|nr:Cullin-domain-containing protein [Suillus lakei]
MTIMSSSEASNALASVTHPTPPASTADTIATTWASVKQGVDHIMTKPQAVSPVNWVDLRSLIYKYFSAIPDSDISATTGRDVIIMGCQTLHDYLIQYFITDVKLLKDQSDSLQLDDEAFLRHYAGAWDRFSSGAKTISHIVSSIKSKRLHYFKDQEGVLEVRTVALVQWKKNLFFHLHTTLASAILRLMKRQRDGETVDQSLIKNVVDSFVSLDVYEEHLETLFLDAAEKYYKPQSQLSIAEGNLLDYLTKAGQCLEEERDRADRYLPLGTREKLLSKCEHILIRPHADLIWETFQKSLDFHNEEVLQSMYASLSHTSELERFRKRFEEHVKMAGLSAFETLLGEILEEEDPLDPKAYVDMLLEVYHKYSGTVTRSFGGEVGFVASFDKACREFVNRNAVTGSSTTKSPELLAKHADALLRKNNKVTEQDLEAALNHVIVLFKYIEDKDVFPTFYAVTLSKRLFLSISASNESEMSMISKLKEVCGLEYTNKLQRMLTDISLSKDLTDECNERMQDHSGMNINFSIMVLGANFWPLSVPTNNFIIPPEVLRAYDSFSSYYQEKHSGRRLTWLWNYSSNELLTDYLCQKYILMTSSYQMAVLLQYNTQETISLDELMIATGIRKNILLQVLALLVKAQILINEDTYQYDLNLNFKSKKLRVLLNRPIKAEVQAESSELLKIIEEDRQYVIQATIVRIMKERKNIDIQPLIQEVVSHISPRFVPKVPDIKKVIKKLLENEYIERMDGTTDTFAYV